MESYSDIVALLALFWTATAETVFFVEKEKSPASSSRSRDAVVVRRWWLILTCYIVPSLALYGTGHVEAIATTVLWRPIAKRLSQYWPRLLVRQENSRGDDAARSAAAGGGPLGYGNFKLVQVLVSMILWRIVRGQWGPESVIRTFHPKLTVSADHNDMWWTGLSVILAVILLGIAVNGVLALWSTWTKSRGGHHRGLQAMVAPTIGRPLTVSEHGHLWFLAFLNAASEEITSRGFWRAEWEFVLVSSKSKFQSNFWQGIVFGLWHYHGGVPNGVTGFLLTSIYGWIMGYLADQTSSSLGLIVPIAAHTMADYYIFAMLVRQSSSDTTTTPDRIKTN